MSFGPPREGQHTFQRLDGNLHWRGIPEFDEAGPRAIAAYLRTYGPATPDHIHYWFGEGLSAGRKRIHNWFAGLGDQLVAVDVHVTVALIMREDVDAVDAATPSEAVRSLPGHDQWLIGPGTKDAFLPNRCKPMSRNANPVVVGGVVCGTWARTGDELIVGWLDERRRPDRAVEQQVTRLSRILGRNLKLHAAR